MSSDGVLPFWVTSFSKYKPLFDILKKNNNASLVFYDKEEKIQLRVKVECEVYNQNSIRDVIPFPKTQSGLDPLTDAPSYISENILEEYNLKYINKDE